MYVKIKRILDFICALIVLILLIVPLIIISIAIKIEDGGPIIYKSKRMGKNLKPFNVYKLRSMRTKREELKSKLSHNEMVTKVGKIIRKTSIDELPQLINILKGDMSFIGPRPWITEYYKYFTDKQKRRCDVLPGISGLAQVKGRNGISVLKKIEYDLDYVENISFILDVKIFFLTIKSVILKIEPDISEIEIKKEIKELISKNNKGG